MMLPVTRKSLTAAAYGLALIFISGCTTTPDISGWAQNSADLAGAVANEGKQITERLDQNYAQYKIGTEEGWYKQDRLDKWKSRRETFATNKADIDATLEVMTGYADAIAKLAASGEAGESAVEGINDSVTNIVETVGASNPISTTALAAFKSFAAAFTKVQAQNSLAEVMIAVDGDIQSLGEVVKAAAMAQKKVIDSIRLQEFSMILSRAGKKRMRWYENNKGFQLIENEFRDEADPVKAHAVVALVSQLEPRYRARQQAQVDSIQWKKTRLAALNKIVQATETWRKAHSDAASVIQKCGGLRSLRLNCGNYTAANLKLAADQIRTVVAPEKPELDANPETGS
jgi:hypothetical protein